MNLTDTPRTDADHVTDHACPHCGSGAIESFTGYPNITGVAILKKRECGSVIDPFYPERETRTELCREREKSHKLEAEVEYYKNYIRIYVDACEPIRVMSDKLGLQLGHCIIQHGVPLLLDRHEKLEAEVERLRELIMKLLPPACMGNVSRELLDEVATTINPDNK